MISQSQAGNNCNALTKRVYNSFNGNGILHYLNAVSEVGFRIKGFNQSFLILFGLVVHHSMMREALPCWVFIDDDCLEDDSDEKTTFGE